MNGLQIKIECELPANERKAFRRILSDVVAGALDSDGAFEAANRALTPYYAVVYCQALARGKKLLKDAKRPLDAFAKLGPEAPRVAMVHGVYEMSIGEGQVRRIGSFEEAYAASAFFAESKNNENGRD